MDNKKKISRPPNISATISKMESKVLHTEDGSSDSDNKDDGGNKKQEYEIIVSGSE